MSATKLLRAGSAGLRSTKATPLATISASRGRSLHSSSPLFRREAPTGSQRTTPRASQRSSSSSRTAANAVSRSSSRTSEPAVSSSARAPTTASRNPASPSSGTSRQFQAKVEVVPFRISTEASKEYLTTLATTEVMPRVMSRWAMIKHQLLSLIGLRSMSDPEGDIVKLEKMTELYLPIWLVDASFEIKCRGNDGRAEANFITIASRFPGHTWKPMDTMPMFPPPPSDMVLIQDLQKDPSYSATTPKEAWNNLAMVDYESYELHQKRKDKHDSNVEIKGGIPDPLPFTVSPLFLPDMLRKQLELKDVTFTPDLAAGVKLPGTDAHGMGLTIQLVDEEGRQLTAPPVRFEPETLKLDMFAAYPVLMPLHLAEFSYMDEEENKHYITMVLGAWDKSGSQFCFKEKNQDWQYSFVGLEDPFLIQGLNLYPRAPIKTSLNVAFEREREKNRSLRRKDDAEAEAEVKGEDGEEGSKKAKKIRSEWEEEWDRRQDERTKSFQEELTSRMMEKLSSEQPIKAAVEQRSLELLKRVDWIHWEKEEREAYQRRVSSSGPSTQFMTAAEKERFEEFLNSARKNPTEPQTFQWLNEQKDRKAEIEHPDRKAGLGTCIYWTSPHVQRLSLDVYANRRYLKEGIPEVLVSRKRMAIIAEGGHSVDGSLIQADGQKLNGKEAYKTIVSADIDARQMRETLKPRWPKALETLGR